MKWLLILFFVFVGCVKDPNRVLWSGACWSGGMKIFEVEDIEEPYYIHGKYYQRGLGGFTTNADCLFTKTSVPIRQRNQTEKIEWWDENEIYP